MLVKPALQAALRVFGLCGSCVVLVWADLWFLVTCVFWLWSACPIHIMWFLWIGGLARQLDADDCAPTCGFCGSVVLPSIPMRAHLAHVDF